MEGNERKRFLDDLLDASLAQYRSAQPRPGLENRILVRLRAEPETLPWLPWAWRIGIGLAAAIVLALVSLAYRQRPRVPTSAAESPRPAPSAPASAAKQANHTLATRRIEPPRKARVARSSGPSNFNLGPSSRSVSEKRDSALPWPQEPRRDVFPSPAPLSEQERLLLSYVRQYPGEALSAFPKDGEPLAILEVPDLKTAPLEAKELPSTASDQTE